MTFKRFGPHDVVLNTIVTKPDVNFTIHSGTIFYQLEKPVEGNFSNNVKHVPSGHISLHEMNINRPKDSLVFPFINKLSTRFAWKTISTSTFDDNFQFLYGDVLEGEYPDSGSISRIYIPAGIEFSTEEEQKHENKKYITALENVLKFQNTLGSTSNYESLGTENVNMICIPGMFYGSSIEKGTIELEHYVTGTLNAAASDTFKDGRIFQTSGPSGHNSTQIGVAIYDQGIIILTGSHGLHSTVQENYFSNTEGQVADSSWINFGTGIPQVGKVLEHGNPVSSSYVVKFKGNNRIPTLTMFAYSEMGKDNYSTNPTFTAGSRVPPSLTLNEFSEGNVKNKKVNRSEYADQEDNFKSNTYISKIGIYDKYKNLIAIASLANPVKKTEKRDFMFKLGIDF